MSEEKKPEEGAVKKDVNAGAGIEVKKKSPEAAVGKVAVVLVRGRIKIKKVVRDTLDMLRLYNNNFCVIIPQTPTYMGMIKKVSNYVTWGEIDSGTEKEMTEKRGEKKAGEEGEKGAVKPYFRLSPPRKGYGRKGITIPFSKRGALGYRGDKINELIKRML